MDSITQITLGAAMGEAVLGKKIGNKAMAWGALAGTIPDLDILLYPFLDAVGRLTVHRGYSHSLFFAFIMAPLLGWLVARWYKGDAAQTTFKDWSLLFFWGLFTHPILDAFTTYGTQLFLPFSDYRVAFNNIFVADPLYTLPFILCLLIAMFYKRTNPKRAYWNWAGIGISTLYLCFTLVNKYQINQVFSQSLKEQNIEYERFMTSPSVLNNILWYGVVEGKDGYYIGFHSFFDTDKKVAFDFIPKQDELITTLKNTKAFDRLNWFSKGYYVIRQQDGELFFNDVRFGKMGFEGSENNFVFSFQLEEKENGELTFEEVRHIPEESVSEIFGEVWKRIKGI